MPIIKSAKKRVKVAEKATIRNVKTKRNLKTALKNFHAAVTGGKKTSETSSKAQSTIDIAAKKGIIHKNKAARKKSQLAKAAKAAGIKPTASSKKSSAKPAAKKPTPKKPATKTAAAKKTVAKKPAAKKTTKK